MTFAAHFVTGIIGERQRNKTHSHVIVLNNLISPKLPNIKYQLARLLRGCFARWIKSAQFDNYLPVQFVSPISYGFPNPHFPIDDMVHSGAAADSALARVSRPPSADSLLENLINSLPTASFSGLDFINYSSLLISPTSESVLDLLFWPQQGLLHRETLVFEEAINISGSFSNSSSCAPSFRNSGSRRAF